MRASLVLLPLLLWALAGTAQAQAPPDWRGTGTLLAAGGHLGWLPSPGRGCRGFTAEALFGPASVGQLSRRLAENRLGVALRFHRSLVRKWIRWQGVELCLRRGLGSHPQLTPWLELGLGQLRVSDDRGGDSRNSWSGVLGAGLLRSLGSRWSLQLAVHGRSLETGGESYSHAVVTFTLGGRIDA